MMTHPNLQELANGEFNRYEVALAAAKCARLVTDEYVEQREAAEKAMLVGSKDASKPITNMIDPEIRDEKAVRLAVHRMARNEYRIIREDPKAEETAEETEETEENA